MATTFYPNGLLEVSKLGPRDYAPLPKVLATFKVAVDPADAGPLFRRAPEFSDLDALQRVRSVDSALYACFSSLLSGLSSGPIVIMGAFRALDDQSVVVRMHAPARPKPSSSLPPMYIRVSREHAQLAVQRGWVPANAAPWLMLYAAVYYPLIGDPQKFYARKDLGGPDNAAWLVFYGKDSARAEYDDDQDSEEGKESGAGKWSGAGKKSKNGKVSGAGAGSAMPGGAEVLQSLYAGVFGYDPSGEGEISKKLLTEQVFGAQASTGMRAADAKLWMKFLKQYPLRRQAPIVKALSTSSPLPEPALLRWMSKAKPLSADMRESLFLFLELNGALKGAKKERYSQAARELWSGIRKLLRDRVPVVLELDAHDDIVPALAGKEISDGLFAVRVLSATTLELPNVRGKDSKRALRLLGLDSVAGHGETLRVKKEGEGGGKFLEREPSAKPSYVVDIERVLRCARRLHAGANALAILPARRGAPSFSMDLERNLMGKLKWPV